MADMPPLSCSLGGVPYNKAHLDAKDAQIRSLTRSRDGYAKDAAARAEECDRLSDALGAAHKRIAALEAVLLMNPMAARVADLPDFMVALSEWGCEDPNEQADAIAKFLNSTVGLREYLEDQSRAGGRDGN